MISEVGSVSIFHSVRTLGLDVAENIVGLLDRFATNAGLAGLSGVPCISLEGDGWGDTWEDLLTQTGFGGTAGEYGEDPDSLILRSPTEDRRRVLRCSPRTLNLTTS